MFSKSERWWTFFGREEKKLEILTDGQQLPELRGCLELHRRVRGPDALDHRRELGEGLERSGC